MVATLSLLADNFIGAKNLNRLWGNDSANLQPYLNAAIREAADIRPFEKIEAVDFTSSPLVLPDSVLEVNSIYAGTTLFKPKMERWYAGGTQTTGDWVQIGNKIYFDTDPEGDSVDVQGYWVPTDAELEVREEWQLAVLNLAAGHCFEAMSRQIARKWTVNMEGVPEIKAETKEFDRLAISSKRAAYEFLKKDYAEVM